MIRFMMIVAMTVGIGIGLVFGTPDMRGAMLMLCAFICLGVGSHLIGKLYDRKR